MMYIRYVRLEAMFSSIFNVQAHTPTIPKKWVRKPCECPHKQKFPGGCLSSCFRIKNNDFKELFSRCGNPACKGKVFVTCVFCPGTEGLPKGPRNSWQNPISCREPVRSNNDMLRNMHTHENGQKKGDNQQRGGAHAFWKAIHQLAKAMDGTILDNEEQRKLEADVLNLGHRFETWKIKFQHILTSPDHNNRDHNDIKVKFRNAEIVFESMESKYNCHWLTPYKSCNVPADPSLSPTTPTAATEAGDVQHDDSEAIYALMQLKYGPPRETDGNDPADPKGAPGAEGAPGAAVPVNKASLKFMCE